MAQLSAVRREPLTRGPSPPSEHAHLRRRPSVRLFFPLEAKLLRTPFRARALETVYETARADLGANLKSALVTTWNHPGEPDSTILLLVIAAEADRARLAQVRMAILTTISEQAQSWSEGQRKDYSERVYFELESVE